MSLATKLAICILVLVAISGLGSPPDGIGIGVVAMIALGVIWLLRRPIRYQLALSPTGSTTKIEVVAGQSKKASTTIDAFVRAHQGMRLDLRAASPVEPPIAPTFQ